MYAHIHNTTALMLFNKDLCDTICEVQIRFKMVGDRSTNRLYQHLDRMEYMKESHDICTFYENVAYDSTAVKIIMSSDAIGKWFLDNLYQEFISGVEDCYDELITDLVIKHNDREFIDYFVGSNFGVQFMKSVMRFGTLDQMNYLRTVMDFSKIRAIEDIIEHVANLDVMKFIYTVRPQLFVSTRIRSILSLTHNSVLVKRDLQTLEWLINKLNPRLNNLGFDPSDSDDVHCFFNKIITNGDESLLEWVCLNRSAEIRPAFKHLDKRFEILTNIAVNCSHRIFLLFMQHIYPEHNPTDNHADMLKNLQHIVDSI